MLSALRLHPNGFSAFNPRVFVPLSLGMVLMLALPVLAAEKHAADEQHRGVVEMGGYEIFPENREGNGVYLNHRMLFTQPGQAIVHLLPVYEGGRFTYLARSGDQYTLGVRLMPDEPAPRLRTYDEQIYHAVMVVDGVVFKKVYRVLDGQIEDLLPAYRTADGLSQNESQIVFYHVATVRREEGQAPQYGMRLHLVSLPNGRLRDLPSLVFNTEPSLRLLWVGSDLIQYNLEDGRVESVLTEQFQ